MIRKRKRFIIGAAAVIALLTYGSAEAESRRLIPGGRLVGVAVESRGLIYVGASDLGLTPSPARLSGLKSGDIIETVNGKPAQGTRAFIGMVTLGSPLALGVSRGDGHLSLTVTPGRDPRDGEYRIGAWVRDSAAGVGTLTYIDPKTGEFGALGHAIQDPDARVTIPLSEGVLYESGVNGVTRGQKGTPGALSGDFMARNRPVGTIDRNSEAGISGVYVASDAGSALFPDGLETAEPDEVREGPAQIISEIDENGPKLYSVRILRADSRADTRGLLIEVTDEELLSKTGGIVQGMSGSPIIQNGKLVGAVTHVLVDNPARGYGIFIQKMLDAVNPVPKAA